MLVDSIMTTPVLAILPSTTVRQAACLMVAGRFGGLPVVSDAGTLLGMVSESDFLRRSRAVGEKKSPWWLEWFASVGKTAEDYVEIYERPVEQIMSRDVATIAKDATIDDLTDLMVRRRIKRVPVVEHGKVVGIVARADLLGGIARQIRTDDANTMEDDRIRADAMAALAGSKGDSFIRVRVKDGVVELHGLVFDEDARRSAHDAVEKVSGLASLRDEIVWVEPMAGRLVLPTT